MTAPVLPQARPDVSAGAWEITALVDGWGREPGREVVQFQRARHRVHRADWDYFLDEPRAAPRGVRKLRPVEDLFAFVGDGEEVAPGIRLHLTPGHTPGHCVVEVGAEGDGSRVWLLGDRWVFAEEKR